ncbi:MAG: RIP metalloprotease RseP [Acidobacteria bacterium]|nr:RIP metalloprotease RseP [Acidobacteriota bacterium]
MNKGLQIERRFTNAGEDPYQNVEWLTRDSRITNPDGSVVFEMEDAEIPAAWSQVAGDIMVSKYFRKAGVPHLDEDGEPIVDDEGNPVVGPETSARQVINRLATTWRWWGEQHGYFAGADDAKAFEDEIAYMLLHQMAAPNSPQWFNTGLHHQYGIEGTAQGFWFVDPETGENVESPALQSSLLAGDRVLQIDGNPIRFWTDLQQALVTGSGRTPDGKPQTILKVERDNQVLDIEIIPLLSGADKLRKIGVIPAEQMVIDRLYENSPAARAGLLSGDRILALDGAAIYTSYAISRYLEKYPEKLIEVTIERDGEKIGFPMKPESVVITTEGDTTPSFGLVIERKLWLEYINPLNQVYDVVVMTVNVLGALFSRHSDIGLDKLSGPVGIFDVLYKTALNDIRWFLYILVLINVNLAILNLLPIPILDGGHLVFLAIEKIKGSPLSVKVRGIAQQVGMVLLFTLIIFVTYNDILRAFKGQ